MWAVEWDRRGRKSEAEDGETDQVLRAYNRFSLHLGQSEGAEYCFRSLCLNNQVEVLSWPWGV